MAGEISAATINSMMKVLDVMKIINYGKSYNDHMHCFITVDVKNEMRFYFKRE